MITGGIYTDADPAKGPVFLTKGVGLYTWSVEDRATSTDLVDWHPVRLWVVDPAGLVWIGFQDSLLEDSARRMAGRLNLHVEAQAWTSDDIWDYLLNWGGLQASFSRPESARASSVADLLSRVWPGAQAVAGISDEQAAELDPLGVGRHGASPRPWGAPPET